MQCELGACVVWVFSIVSRSLPRKLQEIRKRKREAHAFGSFILYIVCVFYRTLSLPMVVESSKQKSM